MDNGMDSMLDTYLYETNSLLDQLDELLVSSEANSDFTTDAVNEIFRIMHTIKGSSAMMEFTPISTVSHHIEDLFFYIREHGIDSLSSEHKKSLFDLMFLSEDYLRKDVEKVERGEPLTGNIDNITQKINDFLKKINPADEGDSEAETASEPAPSQEETAAPKQSSPAEAASIPDLVKDENAACFINVLLEEGCGMENLRAFMIINALRESELTFRYYPESLESDSDSSSFIIENGFYLAFDDEADANKASTMLQTQGYIRSYELIHPEPPKKAEPPKTTGSAQAKPSVKQAPAAPQKKAPVPVKQNLISVNLSKLDSLNDIVGEIVITESMVTSNPDIQNIQSDSFLKAARQLRKLTGDLQDISMSLRMVPVSGVFQKMNRIVRDMKQKLNKDVVLTIVGEDTEIDKSIVDSIQDPIMHLVRNAMDHGIEETAEERIQAGKNPQGEIILAASHTSSEVVISIQDDGYGMDHLKLLDKAENKGLLTKPKSEYSKKEALNLILLPGFSTNTEVTEYSGRGVGMDVVKKNVESVGGVINIDSELGSGTTMTLKIPLTLAIVDGMKVTVGKSIFTIPISNIRQSFKVKKENIIKDSKGEEIIECMNEFYPIVRIHELYQIHDAMTDIEDGILIWVEAGEHSYCLFVDELIGEQQVVVKPLPAFLNNFNIKRSGISGCTILGDGNISVILDIQSLYTRFLEY